MKGYLIMVKHLLFQKVKILYIDQSLHQIFPMRPQ